ncbi:hypothetical protein CRUP_001713 [Coryphaenoides rupestris]|nr:hypothetical protein CRUP_001713 [Coryphaenoides rupestris]
MSDSEDMSEFASIVERIERGESPLLLLLLLLLPLLCGAPRGAGSSPLPAPSSSAPGPWLAVPIKNIERELICPICKELFTHPLILPCQHSVCHKCIRELLMLNHDDSFDAGSECSMPGSPRSRVPSPSMERLDRLVRSGRGAIECLNSKTPGNHASSCSSRR